MIKSLLAFLAVTIWVSTSFATCNNNSAVIHINGVNTTAKEAELNAEILRNSLASRGVEASVELAYNPTQGVMLDIIQASLQKINESPFSIPTSTVQTIVGVVLRMSPTAPIVDQGISDVINNALIAVNDLNILDNFTPSDFDHVLSRVIDVSEKNGKVLLVPHSQGNFFANAVVGQLAATLIPKDSVSIVGVATPTSHIAGDGDYLTSTNDQVIQWVRTFSPTLNPLHTIRAVDEPGVPFFMQGHSFVNIYMNPELEGESVLIDKIQNTLNVLSGCIPGAFEVIISWKEPVDIDLHVSEPGRIVTTANPLGLGQLIHTTTTAGYEHYRLDGFSTAGQYIPQIHYRTGNVPADISVLVKSPDGELSGTISMNPPDMWVALPEIIGVLNVSFSSDEAITFTQNF